MEYNGFQWTKPYELNTNNFLKEMHRLEESDPRMRMSPDRFLSSIFEDPGKKHERLEKSTNIHLSSRLPSWLCALISMTLGKINVHHSGDDKRCSDGRVILSTLLHMATLLSGLCFGACGLYFNVYDTLSTFTKTTVLASLSRCVIGVYWILLGVYSHSLAARLINNPRVVDCIRLHSKTFMKVNMVFIIFLVFTSVLCLNFYTNIYLLHSHPPSNNGSRVYDANCDSIGVNIVLCKIYFVSKVVYSVLSLGWNLMVASICLSICRTLTIGVRRFIRELNFDAHIYEEYQMTQMYGRHLYPGLASPCDAGGVDMRHDDESWTIWDDDIKAFDDDTAFSAPSSREHILRDLRNLRRRLSCHETLTEVSVNSRSEHSTNTRHMSDSQERRWERRRVMSCGSNHSIPYPGVIEEMGEAGGQEKDEEVFGDQDKSPKSGGGGGGGSHGDSEGPSPCGPPIISNQDLMFTYFKLMRRLSSTSRLLQRWMSSWITFVLLWCVTLIIYWVSHEARLTDLLEFLLPVVGIAFMTSAYAEVNFEGGRVLKCLLPTEGRLPVIYYIQNAGLELKIFGFVMTYNVLVTVLAGVAVTIASRIIMEQIT